MQYLSRRAIENKSVLGNGGLQMNVNAWVLQFGKGFSASNLGFFMPFVTMFISI